MDAVEVRRHVLIEYVLSYLDLSTSRSCDGRYMYVQCEHGRLFLTLGAIFLTTLRLA